jgi:RNA recognition motif-containing protein
VGYESGASAAAAAAAAAAAGPVTGPASATIYIPSKVFVGGLATSLGLAEFREYFERYGNILDAVVMIDRATNRSRGFGFVIFDNEASARAVLAERHVLHDKQVEIKAAKPRGAEDAPGGGGGGGGGGG